jgi:hypothetical protein
MSIEARLADLAAHVELPPAPDMAARVRGRVEAGRPARRLSLPLRLRPALAVPLAVLVVAVGGVAAVPSARSTVLRWLGLGGVKIERVPETPRVPPPTTSPPELDLGRPVALGKTPFPRALGRPDGVYVDADLLTMRYRPRPGLPESANSGAGALVTQVPGRTREEYIHKAAGPGTRIEPVRVGGQPGYWLTGEAHTLILEGRGGTIHEAPPRLAGNTLIWRRGDKTLRLEADVTKSRALAIARSVR